jgi:hypothetical protein
MVINLVTKREIDTGEVVSLDDTLSVFEIGSDAIDTYFNSFSYRTTHYP